MATKKDLVEAYSFSRRRLITAFVSGAPGGREVEPSRPGRTIVGGIALAVLMIAGAAVLGILTDRDPGDWQKVGPGEREGDQCRLRDPHRGRAAATGHQHHLGHAAARAGPEDHRGEPRRSSPKADRGATARASSRPRSPRPTRTSSFPRGGRRAPARDSVDGEPFGVKVSVTDEDDGVEVRPNDGLVVRSKGTLYLVAESLVEGDRDAPRGYYHEIDEADADPVLTRVAGGTNRTDALDVDQQWLDLFTPGAPLSLQSLGLERGRIGQPPRERPDGVDEDVVVGRAPRVRRPHLPGQRHRGRHRARPVRAGHLPRTSGATERRPRAHADRHAAHHDPEHR